MFLEIIPGFYDFEGRKSFRPYENKRLPPPTFPFGRYVSQPVTFKCQTFADMRKFLIGCRQGSDEKFFGKKDHWLPPDEFEKLKKGDCDDFAMWTWRQLLEMGYSARFVVGRFGRYGAGHAWATFADGGKTFIADGTRAPFGMTLPKLYALSYHPTYSVTWNGRDLSYYSHKKRESSPPIRAILPLLPSYIGFWMRIGARLAWRVPYVLLRRLLKTE